MTLKIIYRRFESGRELKRGVIARLLQPSRGSSPATNFNTKGAGMRRMILEFKRMKHLSGCCPGHDTYPSESYGNRRSKKALSNSKKAERRLSRRRARVDIYHQLN